MSGLWSTKGFAHFNRGEWRFALDALRKARDLIDRADAGRRILLGGADQLIPTEGYFFRSLVAMGFVDEAVETMERFVQAIDRLEKPFDIVWALMVKCSLCALLDQNDVLLQDAAKIIEISERHGYTARLGNGLSLRGLARSRLGELDAGIADTREGMVLWRSRGIVSTASKLAGLDGARVAGIAQETLIRLTQQARLQKQSAATGVGALEIVPHQPGLGFDKLPVADLDDLYFDFEGDPMYPGGLEYLCGVLWQAPIGDTEGDPVPGHPNVRFRAFWAHDRVQEKQSFADLMAFLMGRLARSPAAHLYHYAPYEKTALRRLASMHATAETAVDELLRTNRMVDLYRVVRESVRVGEPGYSIKNLERFYMPARTTAVASGGDSLVIYNRFRETDESSLLNDLRDYDRDDCLTAFRKRTTSSRANTAGNVSSRRAYGICSDTCFCPSVVP